MNLHPFKIVIIGIAMISLFSCTPKQDFTCTLKGTVIERKSDTLILGKITEDPRFKKIFIPIMNGQFEYKLKAKDVEAWELTFMDEMNNGSWRSIKFFNDQKEIRFELYPQEKFDQNMITGGKENQAYADYELKRKKHFDPILEPLDKIRDSLIEKHVFWNPQLEKLAVVRDSAKTDAEVKMISKQLDSLYDAGAELTDRGKAIQDKVALVFNEMERYQDDYFSSNTNMVGYYFMVHSVLDQSLNDQHLNKISEAYPVYAQKYPEHPYTGIVKNILEGKKNIRVGGHFIDFTLPDLNGNKKTLSKMIEGKIAVIDLWATWCGPCIMHSRAMLPIYNEYRDLGFTIVGVAAEIKDTKNLGKRLEIEKWPWENLVELDHQNHIWDTYGATFGGGKIILVDQHGVVLAINPSPDEIRAKLKELL